MPNLKGSKKIVIIGKPIPKITKKPSGNNFKLPSSRKKVQGQF